MDQSLKQIKTGAAISYAALLVNIVATLIYLPWMVSMIGKANYAMYTLAISFINIFVMDFGLGSSVSKFVAQYRVERNVEKENEFASTIFKMYLILDSVIIVVLFILFFFVDIIYKGLTPDEISTFKGLYIIVAFYTVVSFPFIPLTGILYAYEKIIELKLCEMLQKIISIALVVFALLYQADVILVVSANALSTLIALVAKFYIVKRYTQINIRLSLANLSMFKEVVSFSIWVTVQALAQRCLFTLAPTILGMVAASGDIAVFSPAMSIEAYFASVAAAVNGFFIMKITQYVASNEKKELYELLLKVGRCQLLLLGMIYVVFLCVGEGFIYAWMGKDFRMAWPSAMLIMLPDIMIFSEQVANTAAIAQNLVKQQAVGYVIMAVVCVMFSFPLSSILGAVGAAGAIAAAYMVLFIYNNVLYTRKMKLNMWKFLKECYGKKILPILLVGAIGYYICGRFILLEGWTGVVIKAVVVMALYILVMFKAMSREEKAMISRLIKSKRNRCD